MTPPRRYFIFPLLAALFGLAFLFALEPQSTLSANPPAPAAAPGKSAAASTAPAIRPSAVRTLDRIRQRGTIICGVKYTVVPFGFMDETTGELDGFDVDISRYIANALGVGLELRAVTAANRTTLLKNQTVDLVAATMTHRMNREADIDFSITYFMDGQKLLVKKGSGIRSVNNLSGRTVGTARGSTAISNLTSIQPLCRIKTFSSYPAAFLALKQGRISAVTTDSTILLALKNTDSNPEMWEIVGDFISDEPYGLGIPENDSDFRDFINRTLAEMWLSGDYMRIYNKWFGPKTKFYLPTTWKMEIWPGTKEVAPRFSTPRTTGEKPHKTTDKHPGPLKLTPSAQ